MHLEAVLEPQVQNPKGHLLVEAASLWSPEAALSKIFVFVPLQHLKSSLRCYSFALDPDHQWANGRGFIHITLCTGLSHIDC